MSEIDVVPLDKILTDRIKILIMDKKLKQLEAENEKLKNKNNSIHSITDDLQQRNHNLTLENEELRKELELYKNQSPLATQAFVTGYKSYKKQSECNYELWQKAEKVLYEIEKVVANNISYMDTALTTCAMKEVLQLIKQAKEN